jgi:hypothetical protein
MIDCELREHDNPVDIFRESIDDDRVFLALP